MVERDMARRKPTPPPRAIGVPGDVRLMNATAALLAALGVLALGVVAALWMARQPVFALRAIRVEGDVARNSAATIRAAAMPRRERLALPSHFRRRPAGRTGASLPVTRPPASCRCSRVRPGP